MFGFNQPGSHRTVVFTIDKKISTYAWILAIETHVFQGSSVAHSRWANPFLGQDHSHRHQYHPHITQTFLTIHISPHIYILAISNLQENKKQLLCSKSQRTTAPVRKHLGKKQQSLRHHPHPSPPTSFLREQVYFYLQ